MKELRCLSFSEQEVATAILERRKRLREKVPEGSLQRVSYHAENGVTIAIHTVDAEGVAARLNIPESEGTAALVNFCMSRKIPMPVDADKYLHVINEGLTLMITMRFNRSHRSGHANPDQAQEVPGDPGRFARIVRPPPH